MSVVLENNAAGTLAQSISASATQVQLTAGDGAKFPALGTDQYFYATLASIGGALEIVRATYRSGDVLGILRGQEGTLPKSFTAGSRFELRVTVGNVTALIPEPQITISSTAPADPALDDLWLETNADSLSGEFYAPVDHTHSDMVTLAGTQTVTGAKTFRPTSGNLSLSVRKQLVSNQAVMDFRDEAGVQRNILGLTSGVDSDFFIGRYDSEGAWQGSVVYIPSATGVANFLTTPTVGGVAVSLTDSGPIDVKWFGTTTTQIQAAIDAAIASGRDLYFSPGSYSVTKNTNLTGFTNSDQPCLLVRGATNMRISGYGATLTVATHAQGILEIQDSTGVVVDGLTFAGPGNFPLLDGTTGRGEKGTFVDGYGGLGFWTYYKNNSYPTDTDDRGGFGGLFPQWGGGTAGTWGMWNGGYIGNMGIGLLIHNNAHNIVVRNCKSTAFNYAGFGIGHNGDFFPVNLAYPDCTNIAFIDCIATDNFNAGMSIMAVDGFQIRGCDVSSNGHPASVPLTDTYADPGYGWTAQATIYSAARNGQVSSCIANSNIRKGLDVHAGRNITITDNIVKGNAVCGIFSNWESTGHASLETSSIVISNNIISGNAFAPINLYQVYIGGPGPSKTLCDTVVSSNIFESSYSGGIRVRYASNVKVADNIFSGSALGGGPSQAFIDCQPNNGTASVDSNVVVTGNQIFDNDGFINAGIRILFDYEDALVSNNMIQMTGASVASGIGFTSCTNVHAYGNVARLGASGTPLALAGTGGLVYGNRGYGGNAPSTLVPATKTQAWPVDSFSFKVAFNGTETPTISENTAPSYIASVQSLPTGFSVSFSGLSSVAENFRATWVITTAEGIVCIGTSNPFIYLRGVSNTAVDIGIKASPGGANEPASTITFGELDITIFFS